MKPAEIRANAAGYLDGARTLVRTVEETFKTLEGNKTGPRVECPTAIYECMEAAEKSLQQVSDWLVHPDNFGLDK